MHVQVCESVELTYIRRLLGGGGSDQELLLKGESLLHHLRLSERGAHQREDIIIFETF